VKKKKQKEGGPNKITLGGGGNRKRGSQSSGLGSEKYGEKKGKGLRGKRSLKKNKPSTWVQFLGREREKK